MVRTGLQAAVMAAALGASGLALAQQPTFERAGAEFERDMRAWGVATMPEIDALGEKLIPLYMPGEGLTPIDTSKCAQALPLLIDFKNKSLAAATLLTKMAEQLIAINRLSALGAVQGEAGRLRNWAGHGGGRRRPLPCRGRQQRRGRNSLRPGDGPQYGRRRRQPGPRRLGQAAQVRVGQSLTPAPDTGRGRRER